MLVFRVGYPNKYIFSKDNPSAKKVPYAFPSLDRYISSLTNNKTIYDSGIITPGILYYDDDVIVFEKPPAYKNIFLIPSMVSDIDSDSTESVYRLPIPWQVYICTYSKYPSEDGLHFSLNDVYMYFTDHAVSSYDQNLYMAPLTNLYTNGLLCNPMIDSMEEINRYDNDISGMVNQAYDWVWNTGHNVDLTESVYYGYMQLLVSEKQNILSPHKSQITDKFFNTYYLPSDKIIKFYQFWEQCTLEDIQKFSWPLNSKTQRMYNDYYNHLVSSNIAGFYSSDYFLNLSRNYSNTSSDCEDCAYYDEDGDLVEGEHSCDSDYCDCSCHEDSSIPYHDHHLFTWIINSKSTFIPLKLSETLNTIYSEKLSRLTPKSIKKVLSHLEYL